MLGDRDTHDQLQELLPVEGLVARLARIRAGVGVSGQWSGLGLRVRVEVRVGARVEVRVEVTLKSILSSKAVADATEK